MNTRSYISKKRIFNFVPEHNKMKASFAEVKVLRIFCLWTAGMSDVSCWAKSVHSQGFFAKCVSWKKNHQKFFSKKFHINIAMLRNSTLNGGKQAYIARRWFQESLADGFLNTKIVCVIDEVWFMFSGSVQTRITRNGFLEVPTQLMNFLCMTLGQKAVV